MKKNGFTLAEVLITLGVIGVIAAITLPNLMTDTATAQIGPKLAKGASAFEQANKALTNSFEVDKLTETGVLSSVADYASNLSNFMAISTYDATNNKYLSKDGMLYTFTISSNTAGEGFGHKQRIGDVTIDINGATKPGENGTDVFYFSWWNDGSLRPRGGTNWDGGASSDTATDGSTSAADSATGSKHWKTKCAADASPSDAQYCAGHVFENNFKVLYR